MKRIPGSLRRFRNRPPGVGVVEYAAGEVALHAIAVAARRAIARGDRHEADHCVAMILFGNSSHRHTPCTLPENLAGHRDAFVAASRAARIEAAR